MSKRERIEALEARVGVAEKRLAALEIEPPMCTAEHPINGRLCTRDKGHAGSHQALTRDGALLMTWSTVGPETWPASSAPDSIEQTTPECRACGGSGYADYAAVPCPACETVPTDPEPLCAQTDGACHSCGLDKGHEGRHKCYRCPDVGVCGHIWPPVPQWRALVDEHDGTDCTFGPLAEVLGCLHSLAASDHVGDTIHRGIGWNLARVVAVCEGQVGDGWKADPGRVPHGHWGIAWLLAPLSHEPPNWVVVADRAAAWLRNLTDGAS